MLEPNRRATSNELSFSWPLYRYNSNLDRLANVVRPAEKVISGSLFSSDSTHTRPTHRMMDGTVYDSVVGFEFFLPSALLSNFFLSRATAQKRRNNNKVSGC